MLILTPTFLKYIRRGITFSQPFHGHPFRWNEETDEPELCGWGNGLGVWYLNLMLTLLYNGFLVHRVIQVHTELNEAGVLKWSDFRQVFMLFITVYYSMALLFQITLFSKKKQVCGYFRQTVKSVGIFQGNKIFMK